MKGLQAAVFCFLAVITAIVFAGFNGCGRSAPPAISPSALAADYVTAYKRGGTAREDAVQKTRIAPPEVIEALVKHGVTDPAVVELLRISHNLHALELVREILASPFPTVSDDARNAWSVLSGEKDREELTGLGRRVGKTETDITTMQHDVTTASDDAKSAKQIAEAAMRGVKTAVDAAEEAKKAIGALRTDLTKAQEELRRMVTSEKLEQKTRELEQKIREEADRRAELKSAVNQFNRQLKASEDFARLQERISFLREELQTVKLARGELESTVNYMKWRIGAQEGTVARLTGQLEAARVKEEIFRKEAAEADERARKAYASAEVIYVPYGTCGYRCR